VNEDPQWEFKNRLGIHDRMKSVVELTISAARAELATARKKLRKMQYGS
jgi:hypothetical protein